MPKPFSEFAFLVTCELLSISALIDPKSKNYDKNAIMKAMMGGIVFALTKEEIQVHGVSSMGDLTGFTMAHNSFWTLEDIKKSSAIWNVRASKTILYRDYTLSEIGITEISFEIGIMDLEFQPKDGSWNWG